MMFIWIIFTIFIFVIVLRLLKNHDIPWKYISFGGLAFIAVELIDYIKGLHNADLAEIIQYLDDENNFAFFF